MPETLLKCQDLTLLTSLAVFWIGLGKSRSYTSMSSKREDNSRFVVGKGTIK